MNRVKLTPICMSTEPPLDAFRLLVRSEHVNLPVTNYISEVTYKHTVSSRNMMVLKRISTRSNVHYKGTVSSNTIAVH